jgi:hypothetical protein
LPGPTGLNITVQPSIVLIYIIIRAFPICIKASADYLMKMGGLALVSVVVADFSLAAAPVVTPVRPACAQRGR